MLVWRPEGSQSKYGLEQARNVVLNPVLVRTGLPWISVVFRRNENRRLSVYFVDPSALWTSVDRYLERETRLELATPTLARSCSTN